VALEHMSSSSSSSSPAKMRAKGRARANNTNPKSSGKCFNVVSARPQLPNPLSPGIRVVLTQSVAAYLTTSTTVPVFNASVIVPSSFAGFSEYTGLFDQYKVDKAEVWLEPTAAQGTSVFSTVSTAVDLDDANVPTSLVQVQSKQGSVTSLGSAGHYHVWVPHVALAAYGGGVFTSFANDKPHWIDAGSPSVQHYGFKIAMDATPAAALVYRLTFKIHCSFRAPGV